MYTECVFFFFSQKTAYEMRMSDWSSDVCSSDLRMFGTQPDIEAAACGELIQGTPQPGATCGLHARTQGVELARQRIDRCGLQRWHEIGKRRVGKECVSTCRSRWSPYH